MISFQLVCNIKSHRKYSDNFNSDFLQVAIIAIIATIIARLLKFLCLRYALSGMDPGPSAGMYLYGSGRYSRGDLCKSVCT